MFKTSLITLVSLFITLLAWAQTPTNTYVKLLDGAGKPVPSVHVKQTFIENGKAGKERLSVSNLEGKAPLLFNGKTALKISSIGYKTIEDTVSASEIQDKKYTLEEDLYTLNETVVTAQFSPNNPENAVHRVKIIDHKRIEQQGAVTLNDILKVETNIRLEQDNILGSSMSIQGISGENVKILMDGVPIIGRLNGNIDLSQINLDNIERIEIIEGPLSVNYGTNALGGTINLITKDNQKKVFDINLNTYYETVGQYNVNASVGFKRKKHYLNFSGGRNFFDGWSPEDTSRFQQWKPKEQYFGRAQYRVKLKNTTLRYSGEVFNEVITNKGVPRAPFYETAYDDYYKTLRVDNSVFVHHYFNDTHHIDITTAYNYYQRKKNNYFVDLTTLNKELTPDPQEQDTSSFDLIMSRGTYNITPDSSKIRVQLGYDINVESARGKRIEGETQQIGDYALFTNVEWVPIKNIIIRPGLRYAYNTSYNAPLVPSIHIKYSIGKSNFRLSYARGFRAPSIKELNFYFVDMNHNIQGNPTLEAETSNNYQVFWSRQFETPKKHTVKSEIGFFFNDINEMITLAATANPSEYTYINVNTYQTLGLQVNLNYSINQLKITLGGTYTGTYDKFESSDYNSQINYSPEFRSNVLYEFEKQGLSLAFFFKYNGKTRRYYQSETGTIYPYFLDSYPTSDFTLTKFFWQKKLALCGGVKNIFNVKNIYSDNGGGSTAHSPNTGSVAMAWGRSYFLQLRINL